MKYAASTKDQEPAGTANLQTFAGGEGFLKKSQRLEINTDDYYRTHTAPDYFDYGQGLRSERRLETPNYQRFRQSEFFPEESKSARGGSGNSQMKLKDRLSQVNTSPQQHLTNIILLGQECCIFS